MSINRPTHYGKSKHGDVGFAAERADGTVMDRRAAVRAAPLEEFAADVQAKGATPIICSPVANAGYGKKSASDATFKLAPSRRTYGDYAKAVAAEKKLAYVDMTALTAAELAKLGKDKALELYVGDTQKKGKPAFDTTHPTKAGAKRFAELFIADVKAQKLPVAELFK